VFRLLPDRNAHEWENTDLPAPLAVILSVPTSFLIERVPYEFQRRGNRMMRVLNGTAV